MKTILTAAAIAVLGGSSAFAADLPARTYTKAPVMVSPAYSWTGFYLGVNAGGIWGSDPVTFDPIFAGAPAGLPAFAAANGSSTLHPSGFTGGGQVGYNWQSSNWVIGLEADINYARLAKSVTSATLTFPATSDFFFVTSTTSNWMATVRPRLGYAFDRTLLYVTGGLALSEINFAQSITFLPAVAFASGTTTSTRAGWTVGGGAEYAFAPNWSAKLEYLHSDFGSLSFASTTNNALINFTSSAHFRTDLVRVGLNYKFGGPVIARY